MASHIASGEGIRARPWTLWGCINTCSFGQENVLHSTLSRSPRVRKIGKGTDMANATPAPGLRSRELGILNAIAEALNSATDVRQSLERTLTLVATLLGLRTGWVWLLDPETKQFYSAAAKNLPPYLQEPVRMTGRPCWCISEFLDGELTPKNINVLECSRLRSAVEGSDGLRYHASIPLYFQEKPLGIMNVTGPSWRKLTARELRLLSTIAYQVGIAVERARLAEQGTRLARAEERARLAREIHDTLAQELTAIALHVEAATAAVRTDPVRAEELLQKALLLARGSLEEARQAVIDLRTSPLAGRSLPEALGALARAFTAETGIRVQLRVAEIPLAASVESEVYRIAQEAFTNIRKHAQAREVTVRLQSSGTRARLRVEDDGRGFTRVTPRRAGFGLIGMRERAKLLGGNIRIGSRPGGGTRLVVTVPLAKAEAAS